MSIQALFIATAGCQEKVVARFLTLALRSIDILDIACIEVQTCYRYCVHCYSCHGNVSLLGYVVLSLGRVVVEGGADVIVHLLPAAQRRPVRHVYKLKESTVLAMCPALDDLASSSLPANEVAVR